MNKLRGVWLLATVVALVAAAVLLWLAVGLLRPFPPRRVVMATGAAGSDYSEVAGRYRTILAHSGITLDLVPTAGAMENLARLQDPRSGVDAAFLQGGTTSVAESPGLVSLGTIFYEPLWVFVPKNFKGNSIDSLRGRRISIGSEGSGGRALSMRLLDKIGVSPQFATLLSFSPEEAAAKLLKGEIDAAAMMESWDSPVVKQLLTAKEVRVANFPHSDAYVEVFPFLNKLILPAGSGDIRTNCPPEDAILLAPKASLVVRRDLHPAIQYLLLQAAAQVHSGPGIFRKAGQFPAPEAIDLPLSDEAVLFFQGGRPFFQRHLPFWLAVFLERILVLLIPIVGILYPLITLATIVPSLRDWKIRRKIVMLYGELRFLEAEMEKGDGAGEAGEMAGRLVELEEQSNRLNVPASFAGEVYTLKHHISLVKAKVKGSETNPAHGESG
jgi:TRAP-type uncharacterized transport system substrate-binding protein